MTTTGLIFVSIALYCSAKGLYLLFIKPFKKGGKK